MTRLTARCGFVYPGGFRLAAEFEIGEGITALVGASGSGKSTLVSLLAGLLTPHEGEIRFREQTWGDGRARRFLAPERRRVGVAFQEGRLFPHLSVRKNLLYGRRRIRACGPGFDEVVAALEIGDLLGQSPDALSGGQLQRVSLGRALLAGGDLFLLDEPVSALDGPLRLRVLDFLASMRAAGRMMLIVTHDLEAIRRLRPEGVLQAGSGRITHHPAPETVKSNGASRIVVAREVNRCR